MAAPSSFVQSSIQNFGKVRNYSQQTLMDTNYSIRTGAFVSRFFAPPPHLLTRYDWDLVITLTNRIGAIGLTASYTAYIPIFNQAQWLARKTATTARRILVLPS